MQRLNKGAQYGRLFVFCHLLETIAEMESGVLRLINAEVKTKNNQ